MWFIDFFTTPSALQAVTIISAICALGLALAKVKWRGVSLGSTFVFFAGIAAGAFGLEVDPQMLAYAQSFGLVLFVFTLGMQVGPGFVSSFLAGGTTLNLLSVGTIVLGTVITIVCLCCGVLPIDEMMGVLCGATTNTPALGAAQQTLSDLGQPAAKAALSCAVTYPIGTVLGILFIVVMQRWLQRHDRSVATTPKDEAFIASFHVCNPAICGKTLAELSILHDAKCVVSRIWREGKAFVPDASTTFADGDRVLIITRKQHVTALTIFFGQQDDTDWNAHNIDWNALDKNLISQRIIVTRPGINGKRISGLHLRERFGATVTRVRRSGINFVATSDVVLRIGDRLTVVGTKEAIEHVEKEVGNVVKNLDEPNLVAIFLGIFLGLVLGSFPIELGLSYPVRLGLAGGSVVMGLIMGAYGPRFHMVSYTTTSANLMMRGLGLSTYLACLGLDAGSDFVSTVMQPAAFLWMGLAVAIALVPMLIVGVLSVVRYKKSAEATIGMLCGAMANPIALSYANDILPGDKASVAYVTVYPLGLFLRVIIAQVIVMCWFA